MNNQKLIDVPRILFPVGTEVLIKGKIVGLKVLDDRFVENVVKLDYGEQIIAPNDAIYVKDEPETGHADEAPRYLKNILARLRELPVHDREVWLKAIMGEFEEEFSHAKWREGYEQGKLEGMVEREKVKVKQIVADWYEENKDAFEANLYRCAYNIPSVFESAKLNEFERWFLTPGTKPFQTLVNMHQFGYEVEETKYVVTDGNHLYFKGYQEDVEIVILADEQPGTMDYVKKFDTKEEAQKVADILGWKVQEVE